MTYAVPPTRLQEWAAEHRWVSREEQRLRARRIELEEILKVMSR